MSTPTIETNVPIGSLHYYDGNPRRGDVDAVKRLMKRRGWWGAAVAQVSTRRILVGNHRLRARHELWDELQADPTVAEREKWHPNAAGFDAPALDWQDVTDAEAAEIVAGDNRASDMAHNDPFDLHALLSGLSPAALTGLSYSSDDLAALLNQTTPPSLDDLVGDVGPFTDKDAEAFWPTITLRVSPATMKRWAGWREPGVSDEAVIGRVLDVMAHVDQ